MNNPGWGGKANAVLVDRREASFKLIGLLSHKNGTPISLQNKHKDGTSHRTEEPSGTRVHTKVSTLERSDGVETLLVERHRPPDRWKDSTISELGRELMRQEICGARGRRATGAAFNSTTITMNWQEGPLDVLKGQ